ncbi:angiopoietin-related protein 3-like isoform X2 [Syngnathus scovelli]|uniref:angiopoietin-related protein 3-like isoform X2 n=1 Tax=Syngnathus scovelli TaxID=161590 RepID=UPI00210F8C9B|nr:angiopoietin-related protein 3-like isoform X2 [Syngnathus scovelli]
MKTTLIYLLVLTGACLPVQCGKEVQPSPQPNLQPNASPESTRSHFAGLDDVRLLANGLLQLSQSLRDFVHKTKGQINDIFQKLNIFDHSFNQLSVVASEIKEEEEELKKTAVLLKANNEEIRGISVQINSRVDSIMSEKISLQNQVDGLEEKLRSLLSGGDRAGEISGLRGVIDSQEQSINKLLKAVKKQNDQLNYQRNKLKSLEEKLTASTLAQDTMERISQSFNSDTPTLSPYLDQTSPDADLPTDCNDVFNRGEKISRVYAIRPNGSQPFKVFCDMSADHGATVIQRRKDGSVNFDQTWEKYENGFGDFHGEFWLGLNKIHSLLAQGNSILHMHLEDWKHNKRFMEYTCNLGGPESNYTLGLKLLSGDLSDFMKNHTGLMFSTKDRDNDKNRDPNCARNYTGGWWFSSCGDTNLNGRYFLMRHKGRSDRRRGIHLKPGRKASYWLRFTQLALRPLGESWSSSETGGFLANNR